MSHPNVTLVVGATSSMMQALCREMAKRGHALILAGRDDEELLLLASDLNARHGAECRTICGDMHAQSLLDQAGEFHHAVIALGCMEGTLSEIARVNYVTPAEIAEAAAEKLSAQGKGTVVVITSVAGDRGRQSNYHYGSAKAALSAFASGLRNKYSKKGVHVMTVKPGFVDTPMTWGMQSPLIASREYVAIKIADAMEKRRDTLYVPWFWQWIMLIIRHIPERIFKKLRL